MARGSKKIFDELEMGVPFPYAQTSISEEGILNKGLNKSQKEEVRGQGIVLKEKIRKAKSY
jgi:hypothetical protein